MKIMLKFSLVLVLFLIFCGTALAEQNESGREGEPAKANQTLRKIRITTALPDGDQPVITEDESGLQPTRPLSDMASEQVPEIPIAHTPLWVFLDNLSLSDKQNALIQLEVPYDLHPTLTQQVMEIEELWNGGNFKQAVKRLHSLEESEEISHIAAGISWRAPRIISGTKWGTDVPIESRLNVRKPCLDFHYDTENLFAVLKRSGSDTITWTVNMSTDGGQTWQETYNWWGDATLDLDAAVVADYLYVGYVQSVANDQARIRRFFTSDGWPDNVYFWHVVFDKNVAIEELALASNADSFDNRIYCWAILADNSLIYHWTDQDAASWTEVPTGIGNADHGLDACCNEGFASYFLWVSFMDDDDSLHVVRRFEGGGDDMVLDLAASSFYRTSVGAYYDRIMVVFEYVGYDVKYWISYNGGDAWAYGWIAYSANEPFFFEPDVTARKGGGFAVVYHAEGGDPDTCYYRRRDYDTVNWTVPKPFNEVDVITGFPMCVEWVPPAPGYCYGYGAIWIGGNQGAYFDRHGFLMPGDANGDNQVDVGDVVYLINYLFKNGPYPNPLLSGDANCDTTVDVGDVVYLINYLFKSGPAPCC